MRTTLDLDDELLVALVRRFPGTSKTEAIERAVRGFLVDDASRRLRDLAGTLDIVDVSADLRRADRHT